MKNIITKQLKDYINLSHKILNEILNDFTFFYFYIFSLINVNIIMINCINYSRYKLII